MKVCITGATGFLGGHLTRACIERGYEVTILRRKNSSMLGLQGLPFREVYGEISDIDSVNHAVEGVDLVFHVAGLIGYWKKLNQQQYLVNVLGTRNIVEASLRHGVKHFVHTSSVAAVGVSQDGKALDESTAYNARRLKLSYFDTKYEAELEVLKGVKQGLQAVIVNPSVIFGLSPSRPNSSEIFARVVNRKIPFIPPGGFNAVSVEDVVEGHFLALEKGRVGERYILGSENFTYRDFFERVARIAGVKPPRLALPRFGISALHSVMWGLDPLFSFKPPLTPELIRMTPLPFYFSSAKAERELGYRPQPLDETFKKLVSVNH